MRHIGTTCQFSFLHFIVCCLDGIPAMLDTQFLHCLAGEFLYVKTINNSTCFGKCRTYNLTHGIRQVKRYLLYCISVFLVNLKQRPNNIF